VREARKCAYAVGAFSCCVPRLQKEAGEQKTKQEGLQAQFDAMVQVISIEEKRGAE
jgi:hypothetical protein